MTRYPPSREDRIGDAFEHVVARIGRGRADDGLDPIHIAKTIAFIIDNDFINGESIDINGGLFMR